MAVTQYEEWGISSSTRARTAPLEKKGLREEPTKVRCWKSLDDLYRQLMISIAIKIPKLDSLIKYLELYQLLNKPEKIVSQRDYTRGLLPYTQKRVRKFYNT
jgi:hypothetical protein